MSELNIHRLLWARSLRGLADGYVSILLPVYLSLLGMSPFQLGLIATATLFGSGIMTLWVGALARRYPYRSLLLAAAALMAGTGLGFATVTDFWPLLLIAFVGTLNPSSGDVSVFLPLEHAFLAQSVEDRSRTATFARYSQVGTLVAAVGSLLAGAPALLASAIHLDMKLAHQLMFALYGIAGGLSAWIYRSLPAQQASAVTAPAAPFAQPRKSIYILAALFSVDAFGGGFVVQSLLALWLFQKFQLSSLMAGLIFFWTGVLAALSYLVAVRIAGRYGLVNTMVFTHLPSSLLLIAIPFMPTLEWALALLFMRSALSQMDVPTRSSFVMAIVPAHERSAAASVTSVPRSLAAAASPVLAGYLLGISTFGWPLVIGGGLKIVYDLLLYALFRHVPVPEEECVKRPFS
ncbi:MFS transporter [Duganella sp. Root1480D1]|uniref:MFS transporter n=1 Tax=Duganella sp. Root1480D1 TaxID=1736471 RepID=UPI0007097EAE|nr:MFS transporter [Duganella sp. Root1480D1]KQZ32389.1 ABC transporter permease [Duganella sp. Root1480D1]